MTASKVLALLAFRWQCWQFAGSGDVPMKQELKITIRLYPGLDDDLIVWLNSLSFQKGEIIKTALRRGQGQPAASTSATLDDGSLLADIRQVVEATLQASLASLSVNLPAANQTEQTDQAEERLARLDQDLSLGDHW